jgi:hypothetical protein
MKKPFGNSPEGLFISGKELRRERANQKHIFEQTTLFELGKLLTR